MARLSLRYDKKFRKTTKNVSYHNYPQLVFTCAVWISHCLDDLYVTFLLRFAAPFEVEHVPFVAGDFGDRAVLFKPDGWEASNLEKPLAE